MTLKQCIALQTRNTKNDKTSRNCIFAEMGHGIWCRGIWGMGHEALDMGHGTRDIRYGALGMGNGSSGEAVFF